MNDLSSSNYVFYKAGQNGTGIRVVIGKNVTKIPAYLFNPYDYSYSAPKIVNVEFEEESVCESIGSHAFAYCTSMTSITIPNSVTSIGGIAFYNCSTLTDVYYDGTEEEWNKITIATNNTPLQNATIHFKEPETDPNEPGTEEPEQPEIDELILIVGNNNIIITDEILDEGGTIYQLVVTEEGTYTVMGDFFVQFQDAMGMTYSNCSYLTEGTYDVILNTMLIPAAGNYNIEVAYTAPESGDDLEPDPEPSGNPVIDSLPFTYEIPEGGLTTDGVYYDFIAKEDVTLIISCPEDGLMGLSGNTNDYDTDVDGNYILSVPAGETVTLNFWSMNSGIVGCYNVYVMSA
ncbi:MAG: leucine-rich repeat protein [Clostridia bacterium]|nr:leucine-rich repeat protein [Clostridia bacterium]